MEIIQLLMVILSINLLLSTCQVLLHQNRRYCCPSRAENLVRIRHLSSNHKIKYKVPVDPDDEKLYGAIRIYS